MSIVAIIQARMTSTRLPGKILKDVWPDLTMLESVIARVSSVKNINKVVIATTKNKTDDDVVNLCLKLSSKYPKLATFRGSESNVLSRYYYAAGEYEADHIVRITSDCPVIQPDIIQNMITKYTELQPKCDYLSNVIERTFPRGFDVEIFKFTAISKAYLDPNVTKAEQEHVTPYIFLNHPEKFNLSSYVQETDYHHFRLTVDTQDDLDLIRLIFVYLYPDDQLFNQDSIIKLFKQRPSLQNINKDIQQKSVH